MYKGDLLSVYDILQDNIMVERGFSHTTQETTNNWQYKVLQELHIFVD